jgi:hypothetical protein
MHIGEQLTTILFDIGLQWDVARTAGGRYVAGDRQEALFIHDSNSEKTRASNSARLGSGASHARTTTTPSRITRSSGGPLEQNDVPVLAHGSHKYCRCLGRPNRLFDLHTSVSATCWRCTGDR